MTDIICRAEISGLFVRVAALIKALAAHCSALAAGCSEGRQIATRYHDLSQLSGAELARRGLTRQSIARVALGLQCSAICEISVRPRGAVTAAPHRVRGPVP